MNRLVHNIWLLLFLGLCGCASQKYKYNVATTEIFDVKLTQGEVVEMPFGKRSEPYVTCLKDDYAHTFRDAELGWKCILFREAFANIAENDSDYHMLLDTLNKLGDDTLKVFFKEMMKPFIVKPGMETREPALTDVVKKHIKQTVFKRKQEAIVDVGQQRYYLRKNNGFWRIYNYENLDYPED